jgi:hypothetical protein
MGSKTVTIDDLINICPPGTDPRIRQWLGKRLAETQRRNRAHAERVLKYEDLRECLRTLGINPHEWNGYIPPATGHDALPERVRSPKGRANMRKRVTVERASNESERRTSLHEIARVAWEREHEAGLVEPEPSLDELFPFPIPGLQAPVKTLSADTDFEADPADEPTAGQQQLVDDDTAERAQTFMRGPGRQQSRRTSRADRRR